MVNLPDVTDEDPARTAPLAAGDPDASGDRPGRAQVVGPADPADPGSAMTPRFNFFFRWFARRFFGHFDLDDETVERLRALEARGSVVYVMRYSSRLDYLLFNALFLREGLRLSSFANGINFSIYRPFWQALRRALSRKRGRSRAVVHGEHQQYVQRLTREGGVFFLFLRTERVRTFWRGLWRMKHRQDELDLLHEVVRETSNGEREVFLVPLSIFWRKGPRRGTNRFLNLDYGSLSRPSDFAKVGSFLLTYRSLWVKIGEPIDLLAYVDSHRDDDQARITRTVRRSILIYFYREEKIVEGPTLEPAPQVLREILSDAGVREAMRERAAAPRGSMEKAERDVERFHHEIAARMNSTLLAILALIVGGILKRLFSGIETDGLEKVADHAKKHPLVLVPTHRSYFDFLIVSLLFYNSYLVPPHIAARDNMAFGPFGLIFRMAGAFYLRRSFDDPLYKQVFRAYVAYLVRKGFTQEFFIEGGRSRTGKTLAPRLGMVAWDVDAFLESQRRDLFFVPIAITYERLVEESGMVDELEGGKKTGESTLALIRARKYLQRRFGSVHVSFGEPISLDEALGDRRRRFQAQVRGEVGELAPGAGAAEVEVLSERIAEEKRQFVDEFGHRIVERINWTVVASATSVVSAVLLAAPHRGVLRDELAVRARDLVDLLALQGVRMTAVLRAERVDLSESIAFMVRSDLLSASTDARGEIIYFEESRRRALDIYRNSIVHFLAPASILARALLDGTSAKEVEEGLESWLEILYREFFVAPAACRGGPTERLLEHFEASGWIDHQQDRLVASPDGITVLRMLAAQTQGVIECYEAVCGACLDARWPLPRKALVAAARAGFENARLLGLAERHEAANETTFGNAIDLLLDRGVLAIAPSEAGRRSAASERRYAPGEHFDALPALRARLAGAAAAG